jgi:hypothetical protein
MAKLDNGQKSAMAVDSNFLLRITSAVAETARYWEGLTTSPDDSGINVAFQKKKKFAHQIMTGKPPLEVLTYARIFLTFYQEDPPQVYEEGHKYAGQLTDEVLNDSNSSAATFAFVAGVLPGDDTNMNIIW